MKVLAVDPGKTTGMVLFEWGGELPADPATSRVIDSWQLPAIEAEDKLVELLNEIDHLVVESFTFGGGSVKLSRQYDAVYLLGVAFHFARHLGVPVASQGPASIKTAYPDVRLRELGWYTAVAGRHARDALRHALLFTHFTRARSAAGPDASTPA